MISHQCEFLSGSPQIRWEWSPQDPRRLPDPSSWTRRPSRSLAGGRAASSFRARFARFSSTECEPLPTADANAGNLTLAMSVPLCHLSLGIYEHSQIPVAVCCLCADDDAGGAPSAADDDAVCTWCGDGGDLLCCDREGCERGWCEECVERNLGADALERIQNQVHAVRSNGSNRIDIIRANVRSCGRANF